MHCSIYLETNWNASVWHTQARRWLSWGGMASCGGLATGPWLAAAVQNDWQAGCQPDCQPAAGCHPNVTYFAESRADPLARGRPPRSAFRTCMRLIWLGEERGQGAPRGPGGPPYFGVAFGEVSDIGMPSCGRLAIGPRLAAAVQMTGRRVANPPKGAILCPTFGKWDSG